MTAGGGLRPVPRGGLHDVLWQPICHVGDWPELGDEFDRRWRAVDHAPEKTFGQALKEMDALALEIMEAAGVIPPAGADGKRIYPVTATADGLERGRA